MMYCERCNIDFLEGLRYCKWCGQTLIERSRHSGDLPSCPNCATPVQPNWTYCKGCGVRLATAPISPATASCPQCGSMTSADAKHCPTCGYHLPPTENISAGSETPGTAIIAYCPTCNELIDPGSVYCKGCGSALYEEQTPFGESAIICSSCQSFNPVGSAACRVCGVSLIVTSGASSTSSADQSETQIMSEYSSTLPDVADRQAYQSPTEPVGGTSYSPTEPVTGSSYPSTEPVTASSLPTELVTDSSAPTEPVGSPRQDTAERVSRPPSPDFNSGANTLVFDSQGTGTFNDVIPAGDLPPAEPTPPKGNETGLLPGVAGSKFEQPAPTHALPRGRNTGPVEGEESGDSRDNVPPSGQAGSPLSQVTRLDAESLSSRLGPPSQDTFTFSSKAEVTPPEGTLGLRADNRAPTGFENDASSSPAPFVFSDEVAPPNPPSTPLAPQNPPTVPMSSVIDTDGVAADETKVLANAPSATKPPSTPQPPNPPSTVPPSLTMPPPTKLPSTQALSNAVPRTGSLTNAMPSPPTETIEDTARRFDVQPPAPVDRGAPSSAQLEAAYYAANPATMPADSVVAPSHPSVKPPQPMTPEKPLPPKKSSAGLIIGLVVALLIIGLGTVAAWWFLMKKKEVKPVATVTQTETPTDTGKTTEPPPQTAPVVPEGMVMVPAGTYAIGRDDESALEQPKHDVTLPAYFIDRTEVTSEAYKKFVDETNHKPPTNWSGKDYPTGRAQYPVTGVTWQDAADYAKWAGKRLPSEAEWEAAARGPEGRHYPWGNEWLPGQANIGVQVNKPGKDNEYPPQIMAVGGFPQGASPAGAFDMIGNVWEYTADEFKLYPGNSQTMDDVATQLKLRIEPGVTYRVIRGGAFDGSEKNDASYRGFVNASQTYPKTGFRCVKDAK